MTRPRSPRVSAALLALVLAAAACGDDDDAAPEESPAPAETTAPEATEPPATEAPDGGAVDLAAVCPSLLVIQTDWFAEAEHGGLYEMIGEGYTVDVDNKVVSGPLVAGGQATGIDLEVRSGGPSIGFAAPRAQIYTDSSIHIAYSNIDAQALAWADTPLIAIMAPLETNPQIIMWDPDTYPDIETVEDIGEAGVTVNIFGGFGFADVFVAQGIWSADQVDPSYDGSPARFIESRDIAQQGFASAEPYNYEFVFEEYGKRPSFQLLADAGYPIYSQTLSVLPENVEAMASCWEAFIPIAQQAAIDYVNAPDRANAIIIDAVEQFDTFWVYDQGLADYSVATQLELGLVGNGPDSTLGNIDEARVETVLELMRTAGADVPDDLVGTDMFTNEFIDESIGL